MTYRLYQNGVLDVPIKFLIGEKIGGFNLKPTKLEKIDIDIPGVDFYSEPLKMKKRKVILSKIGVKGLKLANFIINYIKTDPEGGDLQHQIDKFIRKQKKPL